MVGASNRVEVVDQTKSIKEIGITMQNTKVVIEAEVRFESEKEVECMTCSFSKEDPAQTKYNFYSCKTCNINWVCESCKKGCHDDHEVLPHLLDHRPTWACCYCVKKGKCLIKNAKNQKAKKSLE